MHGAFKINILGGNWGNKYFINSTEDIQARPPGARPNQILLKVEATDVPFALARSTPSTAEIGDIGTYVVLCLNNSSIYS